MECTTFDIQLSPRPRGFHLVTGEIMRRVPRLPRNGLMDLFLKHTSAALTLNENADPDVRQDFESFFRRAVPDGAPYFIHTLEGDDDMPAHVKASLLGASVTIPIREGRLNLGTWQGVYLCEFRNHGGARTVSVTLMGE